LPIVALADTAATVAGTAEMKLQLVRDAFHALSEPVSKAGGFGNSGGDLVI
jgi:hypothetical protein